jgi:hypothetical protein
VIAAGMLAAGFQLPAIARATRPSGEGAQAPGAAAVASERPAPERTLRIANALAAQALREPAIAAPLAFASERASGERRTTIATTIERAGRDVAVPARLGQTSRRNTSPRAARRGSRSE